MSEVTSEGAERYSPQHPLPEAIQKMERDDTVCRYCGVSYLIHSEIKALEKQMKILEKELERYRGSEEREKQLKEELQLLQEQRGELEMTITVKEAAVSNLTTNLRNEESVSKGLRDEKNKVEKQLHEAEISNKQLKEQNNHLVQALPKMQSLLQQQKMSLQDIHTFVDQRDKQMKEEIEIILSHVRQTCQQDAKEKDDLKTVIENLQSRFSDTTVETEDMQRKLAVQEEQIHQLDKLFTENKQLRDKCTTLESTQADLRKQLDDAIEKSRSLQMECHQFREQYKSKTSEVEELTTSHRRKEQALEMTTQKLHKDLQRKESDLLGVKRELKDLQSKFEQQQQMEADLSRKASKTISETKDLKESFHKAKEEVDNLKQEREAMITSHQNRIEQLRESFKEKLAEADSWQDKLEAAIQKEKERHARELQNLEARLKESFVMELEIEKSKYRELMKKYQEGSQETEEKMRAQLLSIESRYKAEINDLNELLAENRRKAKEMEDELRKEIASLKAIIRDLENRLARLDVGNEELVGKLKTQLRETHQELEETREVLDKQSKAGEVFQEEIKHLQDTVRKECEERFELTEALSVAKEELLLLKRPSGQMSPVRRSSSTTIHSVSDTQSDGGFPSAVRRQVTNLSLPNDEITPTPPSNRRSVSEPQPPPATNRPITSKGHTYGGGVKREYTITNNNNMVFMGDNDSGVQTVGGGGASRSNKRAPGSLAANRRRIAAILGRK